MVEKNEVYSISHHKRQLTLPSLLRIGFWITKHLVMDIHGEYLLGFGFGVVGSYSGKICQTPKC